jgi:hypothetical protein
VFFDSEPMTSQGAFDLVRNRSAVRLAAGTLPERSLKGAFGSHRGRSVGALGGIVRGKIVFGSGFTARAGLGQRAA